MRPRSVPVVLGLAIALVACAREGPARAQDRETRERHALVKQYLADAGIKDPRVLQAMRDVPRHRFVPAHLRRSAYIDEPLPIGAGQTISQPYVVAYMTEALKVGPRDRVLEVGTGSGYQAAVLARVAGQVYSIEIVRSLGLAAEKLLGQLGYRNVKVRIGDGYRGWPKAAPFDAIMVTAAPDHVPPVLVSQLKVGGRLVMPVGRGLQRLVRITRTATGQTREDLLMVRFVPMTGEAQRPRP
jgi:protein-L-isoaspartate(D-aspartate) O-methyltransferase